MRRTLMHAALVVLLFVALWWNQDRGLKAVATETHAALCALQHKEEVSNSEAKMILEASPRGLVNRRGDVIIEAALIQRGIDQRQDTLDALRDAGLDCD